MIYLIFH